MSSTQLQAVLVHHGLVSVDQICHAVSNGHTIGATWLEQLLLWRALDEEQVVVRAGDAAAVPRAALDRLAAIPHEVVSLVPADIAAEHRVMPLWVEADGDVRLAMVDPTDERAIEEVEFFVDRRILREVAPCTAIAWALHRYHGYHSPLWPATAGLQVAA
jgi:hypothetical protein